MNGRMFNEFGFKIMTVIQALSTNITNYIAKRSSLCVLGKADTETAAN